MTENEIIDYLKQNKEKGIAFDFMPHEVREWCEAHKDEPIFNVYFSDGWSKTMAVKSCYYTGIYCLPEDYEPKPKFVPHWEEFEVNEDGCFRSDGDLPCKWYRWFDFLNCNVDRYNNFGGWLYNDGGRQVWTSNACFGDNDGVYAWANTEDEVKPAIPKKIRFWRYRE